jgi:hypothetical protein
MPSPSPGLALFNGTDTGAWGVYEYVISTLSITAALGYPGHLDSFREADKNLSVGAPGILCTCRPGLLMLVSLIPIILHRFSRRYFLKPTLWAK